METPLSILILEDNPSDTELVRRELRKAGFSATFQWAQDKASFLQSLAGASPAAILVDYSVPGFDGMSALTLSRERFPDVPVIVVSGAIGEEVAIETLKSGATDYVLKQRLARLGPVLRRALREAEQLKERKQADEALRRTAEELARSNRELEQYAYVASHDLREPLRTVTGFLQLLRQKCAGRLDSEADTFIDYAVDGAERMRALIDDLLTYSRVGTRGLELAPTDACTALQQAEHNLLASIRESEAQITHGALPTIPVDGVQLTQLFQNLVANALKFHSEAPPAIHVDASRKQDHWVFSVRDNGIGIDLGSEERIFQIFQRLHSRKKYAGTGIGLAVCKKIVERHGGRIWVESRPGEGATFFFTIPAGQ
jgi:signal transduction histidine kinase